jgi:hypothetical protein
MVKAGSESDFSRGASYVISPVCAGDRHAVASVDQGVADP